MTGSRFVRARRGVPLGPDESARFVPWIVALMVYLAALGGVGLAERADAPARTLSGGERQLVAIARAIIARPELLIADEPTGHGGDETALLLVRLFERINRLGTTVLIASDDIAFASRFAHRRFHLDRGMLVDPDATAVQ